MKDCLNCVKHGDYKVDVLHTWCTGCGNYSIWGALRSALVAKDIPPDKTLFVHDIGCNGNGADKIAGYGFKGLHGRAIPLAAGAALANRSMTVIASAGDGAVLSEGINHFVHAIRSNYNIILVIHNNANFALTTGQPSPTSMPNIPMNSSPDGQTNKPMNIATFALSLDPTFVARGVSTNQKQLVNILKEGISHEGFSIVEVMQNCPSYNPNMDTDWYLKNTYDIATVKDYDNSSIKQARDVAEDLQDKIATGVLYRNSWKLPYYKTQLNRESYTTDLVNEVGSVDITKLLQKHV